MAVRLGVLEHYGLSGAPDATQRAWYVTEQVPFADKFPDNWSLLQTRVSFFVVEWPESSAMSYSCTFAALSRVAKVCPRS